MMLATTKVEDFDQFMKIFATKGAEKRKQQRLEGRGPSFATRWRPIACG